MAFALSPDASAQYRWGECLKVTKLSNQPGDSVLVISVVDTCRGRTDTIFVNDGQLTNGSVVLRAPSDSSIYFRYVAGSKAWVMRFDTTDADTIWFLGRAYITAGRIDTSYERVTKPDTIDIYRGPVYWDEIIGKPIAATYFFHEEDTGVPGYEGLLPLPADDPAHLHITAVSAGPSTPIHSFATEALPASVIQPGRWDIHLYGAVNIASQYTALEVEFFKRDTSGTETSLLYTSSPDVNNTTIEAVEWQVYSTSEFEFAAGDRLVAKVYAFSTSVASIDLRWAYEGDSASHFEVPFFTSGPDANDTLFTQLRDTPADYSGQGGKYVAVKATQDGLEFVDAAAATRQIVGYSNYLGTPMDSTADYVWLVGVNGIIIGHQYNDTQDSIYYYWSLDWDWLKDSVAVWAGGGGGASTFLDLTDTPASYSGKAGQVPIVNPGETALEFGAMPVSGALTNATLVWDTLGIATDSSCTLYRMEWVPGITPSTVATPWHPNYVASQQRLGHVRYRMYINTPHAWGYNPGYHSYLLHIVADSANRVMLSSGRITAMAWSQDAGSSLSGDETYSIATIPGGAPPGGYGVGVQYGYSTTSSYRGIRPRMAWYYPFGVLYKDPMTDMIGKHQMWIWLTSFSSTSSTRIYGYVDIHLHYLQPHGYNTTFGLKIARVLYRPMTSDGYLPVELR